MWMFGALQVALETPQETGALPVVESTERPEINSSKLEKCILLRSNIVPFGEYSEMYVINS